MIDLHSHLMPAVDDGARDVAESARGLDARVMRAIVWSGTRFRSTEHDSSSQLVTFPSSRDPSRSCTTSPETATPNAAPTSGTSW